jgi:hypothetical protein
VLPHHINFSEEKNTVVMNSKKSKDEKPTRPSGGRTLRSDAAKKRNEDAPATGTSEDQTPNKPHGTQQNKRKRTLDDKIFHEDMTLGAIKVTLEAQRKKLTERLTRATIAANIAGFDETIQKLKELEEDPERYDENISQYEKLCKEVGGANNTKEEVRRAKHDARTNTMAVYEDSLYFQVPERRKHYPEHIDEIKKGAKKRIFKKGRAPMLWNRNVGHEKSIEKIIESYERDHVGMPERLEHGRTGPSDLHLHVPHTRRTRIGLGRPEPPVSIPPLELNLDHEAIEARRRVEEDSNKDRNNQAITHSERRAAETRLLDDPLISRLSTDLYVNTVIPTARSLSNMRETSGLFLAAAERSSDWLDSYDQMDIVRPGFIAVESNRVQGLIEGDNLLGTSEKVGDNSEDDQQPKADGLLNEFCAEKRNHKEYVYLYTTTWAETTYGRREREHAHMDVRPSSPVLSPPHSPIYPTKADGQTIHIPTDVPRDDSETFQKYRNKFKDQYGVNYFQWPHFSDLREDVMRKKPRHKKPLRGFGVQYDPLDVDALPENLRPGGFEMGELLDEHNRFKLPAADGTSMRLLREALNEPYRPPGSGAPPRDDEESDDEGDLFCDSYMEGSRVEGRGGGEDVDVDSDEGEA